MIETIIDVVLDAICFTIFSRFIYGKWWWNA